MSFSRPVPRNQPLADECYSDPDHAVFLTVRASGDKRPFVQAALNHVLVNALLQECRRSQCALYAYCLMPDHLHVLASPLGDDA
jgi:REP element-mobilizing transposase RayT